MSYSVCDNHASIKARAFIDGVRERQIVNKLTLKGRPGLQPVQKMAIKATVVSYVVAGKPPKIDQAQMIKLLERFEELARRQKMIINAGLRDSILEHLVMELWVNKHALGADPLKLLAVTAYHGAIGTRLPKKFPLFNDTPSIYRYAVVNYPALPEQFLGQAQMMYEKMLTDDEFSDFSDTPGIFKQVVVRNPSDPTGFLRTVQKTIMEMMEEDEFKDFQGAPSVFKNAAISNPSDPRGYMRRLKKIIEEMLREASFAQFTKTPGIFMQAVIRNPSDPRGFLRKIKNDIDTISKEEEFAEFREQTNILQHAALHNPSNPREFLRRTPKALWHAMLVKNRKPAAKSTSKRKPKK